jgi:predicted O-methyltransferase YrrM
MADELWNAVDDYIARHLAPHDRALEQALRSSDDAGLPAIAVAPNQGKLLQILARSIQATRILEVGTLGGYSTIWLARALPESGRLITIEVDPKHAEVARQNLDRAGVGSRVEVRLGAALDVLREMDEAPFDFVFIDADKRSNPHYFSMALEKTRPGGMIVVDNVVREGKILREDGEDVDAEGVRRLFEMASQEPRVSVSAIQTVGVKGHDGLLIALVL